MVGSRESGETGTTGKDGEVRARNAQKNRRHGVRPVLLRLREGERRPEFHVLRRQVRQQSPACHREPRGGEDDSVAEIAPSCVGEDVPRQRRGDRDADRSDRSRQPRQKCQQHERLAPGHPVQDEKCDEDERAFGVRHAKEQTGGAEAEQSERDGALRVRRFRMAQTRVCPFTWSPMSWRVRNRRA